LISGAPPTGVLERSVERADVTDRNLWSRPVPGTNIQYFGLAPTLVGVWQLNGDDSAPTV